MSDAPEAKSRRRFSKRIELHTRAFVWPSLVALMSMLALLEAARTCEAQTLPTGGTANQPFTLFRLGDGWFEGVHGTFKWYKNSDGELLWIALLHCDSGDDAKRVYDARVRKAYKIVKEDPADKNNSDAARMAVLNVEDKRQRKVLTEIVIIIGNQVRDVQSYSTSEARALAAQLRNP